MNPIHPMKTKERLLGIQAASGTENDIALKTAAYRTAGVILLSHKAEALTTYSEPLNGKAPRLLSLDISYQNRDGVWCTDVWDLSQDEGALKSQLEDAVFSGQGKILVAEDMQNLLVWLNTDETDTSHRLIDLRMLSRTVLYDLERKYRDRPLTSMPGHIKSVLSKIGKGHFIDTESLRTYIALHPWLGRADRLLESWDKTGRQFAAVRAQALIVYALWVMAGMSTDIGITTSGRIESLILEAVRTPSPGLNFYLKYGEDTLRNLALMHKNGVPFDLGRAADLSDGLKRGSEQALYDAIDETGLMEIYTARSDILDFTSGMTAEKTDMWVSFFKRLNPDAVFKEGKAGKPLLGAKDLASSGLDKGATAPLYRLLSKVSSGRAVCNTIANYTESAVYDGQGTDRLHPYFSVAAATDRLSCKEPATQNMPRDSSFRSLIKPADGSLLVSADYSQMELRIAAALAIRSQQRAFAELSEFYRTGEETAVMKQADGIEKEMWVSLCNIFKIRDIGLLEEGICHYKRQAAVLRRELALCIESFGEGNQPYRGYRQISHFIGRNIQNYGDLRETCDLIEMKIYSAQMRLAQLEKGRKYISAMRDIFNDNQDPHLITGMSLSGHADEYVGVVPGTNEYTDLKDRYGRERKLAKAVNFGLIYGMNEKSLYETGKTSYGLDWTEEEAAAARSGFFDLYPELGFCQKFEILRPRITYDAAVYKTYKGSSDFFCEDLKYYDVESLTGRRYCVTKIQDALNYRNQGTGAHIIQDAVNRLPVEIKQCLSNQIHDEIVLEVSGRNAYEYAKILKNCMNEAAAEVLQPYGVPSDVDVEIAEDWGAEPVNKSSSGFAYPALD
ncbi:hypothetical protein P5U49_000868 [Neisseria gonorrhoeae]